jgi:hypothetical protein
VASTSSSLDPDDPSWRSQVSELVTDVVAWTGNAARVLEMSDAEVRTALAHDDPVVVGIRSESHTLFGSLRDLERPRRRST